MKKQKSINDELMCEVIEVRYGVAEKIGVAILREGHCTSMSGAIRFFQRIDAEVRQIQTFSGVKRMDTVYTRVGNAKWADGVIGEWVAGLPE